MIGHYGTDHFAGGHFASHHFRVAALVPLADDGGGPRILRAIAARREALREFIRREEDLEALVIALLQADD